MRSICILLLLICVTGFWSCAHRTQSAQQSILDDPSIDQRYKDAMRQKRIIPGMTYNMVEASLGTAHFINYSAFNDGSQAEVWGYKPSLARQYVSAQYGFSTQYLYIAFKEGKVVGVFNDIHIPNVIVIPR
jgi:hypothetical protein